MEKITLLISILCLFNFSAQGQGNVVSEHTFMSEGVVGSEIRISREGGAVKAKYLIVDQFNGQPVSQRFKSFKNSNNILLNCTGAYTSGSTPDGLSIDNGRTVNKSLATKMDGLVIVQATGGIVVRDLDGGPVNIYENGNISKQLNLRNADDRYDFMEWAERERATVFQSHLLIFNNTLRIGYNASDARRERRFLVLTTNQQGIVHHSIIDVPSSSSIDLLTGAKAILSYFNNNNMDVVAAINLDVGDYNNYDVYASGRKTEVGTKDISDSSNLLIYYY